MDNTLILAGVLMITGYFLGSRYKIPVITHARSALLYIGVLVLLSGILK